MSQLGAAIDVRELVTVAEITTSASGLAVEVRLDESVLDEPSVINCDGLHTVSQSMLTRLVGVADDGTMREVCHAVSYALC